MRVVARCSVLVVCGCLLLTGCAEPASPPSLEASSSPSPSPTGPVDIAMVFPSVEGCREVPTSGDPAKVEALVCRPLGDEIVLRYQRWRSSSTGEARRGHYNGANRVDPEPWSIAGEPAGWQWTSFDDSRSESEPWQWTATYADHPFSVSVEATSDAARAQGIALVMARPPSELR